MPVVCPLLGVSESLLICDSCEWTGFRGRGRKMRSSYPFETLAEVDAMLSAARRQRDNPNRPYATLLHPSFPPARLTSGRNPALRLDEVFLRRRR